MKQRYVHFPEGPALSPEQVAQVERIRCPTHGALGKCGPLHGQPDPYPCKARIAEASIAWTQRALRADALDDLRATVELHGQGKATPDDIVNAINRWENIAGDFSRKEADPFVMLWLVDPTHDNAVAVLDAATLIEKVRAALVEHIEARAPIAPFEEAGDAFDALLQKHGQSTRSATLASAWYDAPTAEPGRVAHYKHEAPPEPRGRRPASVYVELRTYARVAGGRATVWTCTERGDWRGHQYNPQWAEKRFPTWEEARATADRYLNHAFRFIQPIQEN